MGFRYAAKGIFSVIGSERNLRFHLAVANLICVFAYFYGISRTEWAILILTVGLVIFAELLNTAVEAAVDTATNERKRIAGFAKDAAAGGVLVCAVSAIAVGVCLFGNCEKISAALNVIFTSAKILIPCLFLGAADIIFVIFGGKNEKEL